MKKTQATKGRHSKAVVAAAMLALPMAALATTGAMSAAGKVAAPTEAKPASMAPPALQARAPGYRFKYEAAFVKMKGEKWIAGVGDGHTIYQNSRGEYFYVEPGTGDLKTVSADYFMKVSGTDRKEFVLPHVLAKLGVARSSGAVADKLGSEVTLLGVDGQGNVIQQNSRGDKFYLNLTTGDMVFVK